MSRPLHWRTRLALTASFGLLAAMTAYGQAQGGRDGPPKTGKGAALYDITGY